MMRWAVLAMLLIGCAQRPTTQDQACAQSANEDPAVKLLMNKMLGSQNLAREDEDLLAATKQDAMLRCLRGRGVIPRGGVERQKPL